MLVTVLHLEQLHGPLDVGEAAATELGVRGRLDVAQEPVLARLDELPAEQREAVVFCDLEGMSYEEMAEVLEPARVYWCDGSDDEWKALTDELVEPARPQRALELLGDAGSAGFWHERYLYSRAASVYGGTQQIQRALSDPELIDQALDKLGKNAAESARIKAKLQTMIAS